MSIRSRILNKHLLFDPIPGEDEAFVKYKCAIYLSRIIRRYARFDSETVNFLTWILGGRLVEVSEFLQDILSGEDRDEFKHEFKKCLAEPEDNNYKIFEVVRNLSRANRQRFLNLIMALLRSRMHDLSGGKKSAMQKNKANVARLFGLSSDETELCFFLYLIKTWDGAESYFDSHLKCDQPCGRKYLLAALDFRVNQLFKALRGKLRTIGMLAERNYGNYLALDDDFVPFFQEYHEGILSQLLFTRIPKRTLPLSSHLVDEDKTKHLLALLSQKEGSATHVLFYGPPGTGKTCLAQSLVKEVGGKAYQVLQDEDNTSKSRRAALMACVNMTNNGDGSTIIVDEADNLLNTNFSYFMRGETQDKGWLNHLLEEPGTRIIWITNDISGMDGSLLRRFAYSMHFKPFGRKQRIQQWESILRANRVKRLMSLADIEAFADEFEVSAGAIDLAVKKAKEIAGPRRTTFQDHLRLGLEASAALANNGVRPVNKETLNHDFSLEGLNIKTDLDAMLEQLSAFDHFLREGDGKLRMNMNLLFHGPPGAGKSELARFIAEELGREIHVKRASDILDPYVGMTEQRLAQAFARAEDEGAVLLIDEADSLLFGRDGAIRSWEISQTNEFLTQMERFRGILVCTTNRLSGIDPASLRRFSVKAEFDFLTPDGNQVFYKKMLAPLARKRFDQNIMGKLRAVSGLAPGDFKTVRDKFAFLSPQRVDHKAMVSALYDEAAAKAQHQGVAPLGF